jgi:hypothetical protein
MTFKIKRGQELKKTKHWTLQMPISKHPKDSMYIPMFLLEFKDDF